MPKEYKCKKCGKVHFPPTGKHCRELRDEETGNEDEQQSVIALLLEVREKMEGMEERMDRYHGTDGEELPEQPTTSTAGPLQPMDAIEEEGGATPASLRKDISLMAEAASRIAQINVDVYGDDEDDRPLVRRRNTGKKSGSQLLASDIVQTTIDWPHLHVRRLVAGKRKSVPYADLRAEEFVVGFLAMIGSPQCKWDYRTMTGILEMIMQDTIDFSWANALAFYEMLGLEVEEGVITWEDKAAIMDKRVTHCRTNFPEKKEAKEQQATSAKPKPALSKCCALFQRASCLQSRDHPPFMHACAYCFKTVSGVFRHTEADCARKAADEAKNGPRRE